ncbi:MAG TPA: ion channel [Rhizomicrobium sp.]|nr:ion channel [Rhizomicrobium sp.]
MLELLVAILSGAASSTIAEFFLHNEPLHAAAGLLLGFLIAAFNMALIYQFLAISARNDDYHNRPTAIATAFAGFLALIGAYAGLYLLEMPAQFGGGASLAATVHQIVAAVYFSAVTISTLGYGDLKPIGDLARITAAIEAINGLIAFGVFTGAITTFMANRANLLASAVSEKKPGAGDEYDKKPRDDG